MARTVKPEERDARRKQILDAVQRLVFSKGYERMTLQDILAELRISSGAFYHYFDSKPAVLEALVERIQQEVEPPLLSIVRDPQLSAVDKLRGFFATLDRLRLAHKRDVAALGRVWYTDGNAVVRRRVDEAVLRQRAPLLGAIVRQGLQEGVFSSAYPEQAGELVLYLVQGMADAHARLLFAPEHEPDEQRRVAAVVAIHAACMDAVERVLGAPAQSLQRIDAAAVRVWVDALRA